MAEKSFNDAQHKVKLGAQTAESATKKAGLDDDLRKYALKLEGDLKKAKADHDRKMSGMKVKQDNLHGEIDVMESEKEKLTKSLADLRSEARAHAQRAAVAAVGAP